MAPTNETPRIAIIGSGLETNRGTIANISVLAGFVFTDTVHNGMAVVVTSRKGVSEAEQVALELAETAWNDRHRYDPVMLSTSDAVKAASSADTGPSIHSTRTSTTPHRSRPQRLRSTIFLGDTRHD